ncbi:MAG: hypothetical protein VKN72_02335 [Nostocales cyanobacterium 94392]|nr:hypothetical protein [Nostocales cyanobacterium 94392]
MENRDGIADVLKNDIYAQPALVPATPWLNNIKPNKPELKIIQDQKLGQIRLYWQPKGKQNIKSWVVQMKKGDEWTTKIFSESENSYFVNDMQVENIAVSGVSRYGIAGEIAVVDVEKK